MSKLIGILIIVAGFWGFFQILSLYNKTKKETEGPAKVQQAAAPANALPALSAPLEASLAQAKSQGADAMKDWLAANQPYLRDPRKAAIELNYARMLVRSDPAGAKRIYQAVKARTTADSPVFDQVKSLGKLFE